MIDDEEVEWMGKSSSLRIFFWVPSATKHIVSFVQLDFVWGNE
jgi:hypothetical protein